MKTYLPPGIQAVAWAMAVILLLVAPNALVAMGFAAPPVPVSDPLFAAPLTAPEPPQVSITRSENNANVSWEHVVLTSDYEIWRGQDPYFNPADPGCNQVADLPADGYGSGSQVAHLDAGVDAFFSEPGDPALETITVIGDVTVNHYWVVRGRAGTAVSEPSNRVGEFDFAITAGN